MQVIQHIHHISATVGGAQENLDFYRDVLGLRLVKQTVNFDDPSMYHLYFATNKENIGPVATFFPYDKGLPGKKGNGQPGRIAFRVPKGSLDYWKNRLAENRVNYQENELFKAPTLNFTDRHHLDLAIVESEDIREDNDIYDLHGSELLSREPKKTAELLVKHLGLIDLGINRDNYYFQTAGEHRHIIVMPATAPERGRPGVGTVHHIAWSVPNAAEQLEWQAYLSDLDFNVTEVKERQYFKAIYMREQGRILFEYATEGPGFTVNESFEELGSKLMLPEPLESRREEIIANLEPLDLEG